MTIGFTAALRSGRFQQFRVKADRAWRRLAIFSFVLALLLPTALLTGFRFIITSSVPKGLWFVHSGTVERGRYVLLCLPAHVAVLGRKAGYLDEGFCPGDSLPLMKRVIAMGGDSVRITDTGIAVNGTIIPGSRRLRVDSRGHRIPGTRGPAVSAVPNGEIWVLGDWFRSWDSRYFGAVPQSRVIGIGIPFVTTPAGS